MNGIDFLDLIFQRIHKYILNIEIMLNIYDKYVKLLYFYIKNVNDYIGSTHATIINELSTKLMQEGISRQEQDALIFWINFYLNIKDPLSIYYLLNRDLYGYIKNTQEIVIIILKLTKEQNTEKYKKYRNILDFLMLEKNYQKTLDKMDYDNTNRYNKNYSKVDFDIEAYITVQEMSIINDNILHLDNYNDYGYFNLKYNYNKKIDSSDVTDVNLGILNHKVLIREFNAIYAINDIEGLGSFSKIDLLALNRFNFELNIPINDIRMFLYNNKINQINTSNSRGSHLKKKILKLKNKKEDDATGVYVNFKEHTIVGMGNMALLDNIILQQKEKAANQKIINLNKNIIYKSTKIKEAKESSNNNLFTNLSKSISEEEMQEMENTKEEYKQKEMNELEELAAEFNALVQKKGYSYDKLRYDWYVGTALYIEAYKECKKAFIDAYDNLEHPIGNDVLHLFNSDKELFYQWKDTLDDTERFKRFVKYGNLIKKDVINKYEESKLIGKGADGDDYLTFNYPKEIQKQFKIDLNKNQKRLKEYQAEYFYIYDNYVNLDFMPKEERIAKIPLAREHIIRIAEKRDPGFDENKERGEFITLREKDAENIKKKKNKRTSTKRILDYKDGHKMW